MAEYSQRGIRKCLNCKTETTKKICPNCGKSTTGSGPWSVRFRFVEDGCVKYKRLSNNFRTKKEAELGMIDFLNTHRQGAIENKNKLLFKDVYEQFIKMKKGELKESSIYTFKTHFKIYILPYFENKDIKKLTKFDLMNWQNELSTQGVSNKYILIIRGTLESVLNFAENIYDIPNLMKKIPKPKKQVESNLLNFYDYEQWKKFQKVVCDNILWDTFFNIQYFMGFRVGETVALSDTDIDFKNNVIHITKSLSRKVEDAFYKITTPKNQTSIRDISMPQIIVDKLKNYLEWKKQNIIDSTFLFGGSAPLSDNTYRRYFNHYSKQAGLPQIRIHDLRHSNASLLINSGANIMLVSKRLGHSKPTETLNRYAKLFQSADAEIINKINELK